MGTMTVAKIFEGSLSPPLTYLGAEVLVQGLLLLSLLPELRRVVGDPAEGLLAYGTKLQAALLRGGVFVIDSIYLISFCFQSTLKFL